MRRKIPIFEASRFKSMTIAAIKQDPEWKKFVTDMESALSPLQQLKQLGDKFFPGTWDDVKRSAGDSMVADGPALDVACMHMLELGGLKNLTYSDWEAGGQLLRAHAWATKDADDPTAYLDALSRTVGAYAKKRQTVLQNSSEAPEDDAPYGRFAFADQRDDVPYEKNTSEEEKSWNALAKHVLSNVPMEPDDADRLKDDLKAGRYSSVLHGPGGRWVFRGMSVSEENLRRLLRRPTGPIEQEAFQVVNRTMRPSQGASFSWSRSEEIALKFAKETSEEKPYAVIFVASTTDNPDSFLAGPGGFYKLNDLKVYRKEEESIGLGHVFVHKIYWQRRGNNRRMTMVIPEFNMSESLLRSFIKTVIQG